MLALTGLLFLGRRLRAQDVLVTGLEQLSALKGYMHTAEEGYRIVTDGLHVIQDIKEGEFNLHRVFIGSLRKVDQAVLESPDVRTAFDEVAATNWLFDKALKTYTASGWLQPPEEEYLTTVKGKVDGDGEKDLATLGTVLQDGAFSMTDGERLRQMRQLQNEIHTRYVHATAYVMAIGQLITGRAKEQAYLGTLKQWYGLQ